MSIDLDDIDLALVALLQEDGRRTMSDMAAGVSLSPTAVKRRVERLERAGVITGYSARVDYKKLGWGVSAFVELRFAGTTSPGEMHRSVSRIAEVGAVYTTAGDQDVIALVRVRDVDHLRDVIHRLRAARSIVGTRTHLILHADVKDGWHPPPGSGVDFSRPAS